MRLSEAALREPCAGLEIEPAFLAACLEESMVAVEDRQGRLELSQGTALRLRRLQRICLTFHVDVHVAVLLISGGRRV